MRRFIPIIIISLLFLSCRSRSGKEVIDPNEISVLILPDSVIVYSGKLEKSTPVLKYSLADKEKLDSIISIKKKEFGDSLFVLFKLSWKAVESGEGLSTYFAFMSGRTEKNPTVNYDLADADKADKERFGINTFGYKEFTTLNEPTSLDLNLPKDEEEKTSPVAAKNTITCILISSDSIYCYRDSHMKEGDFYSIKGENSFGRYIANEDKRLLGQETIIIKPSEAAGYQHLIDLLDQITINRIKKYAIVKLLDEEKTFLHIIEARSAYLPQPAAIKTPASVLSKKLPDNYAMLIEIREDNSIWYTAILKNQNNLAQKVDDPVKENLAVVIADFSRTYSGNNPRYLIKEQPNSAYPVFEKVTEALKQNNIKKYELVTSLQ